MRWIFVLILLFPCQSFALEDGTLLFVENSHNLVESYTKSSFSHVAIVIDDCVYEANPPQVKKQTLQEWCLDVGKLNEGSGSPALVSVFVPNNPYSKEQVCDMKTFLEKQVGRRYSIKGYLTNTTSDGIHCSEMCSLALEASGKYEFSRQNCTYSPGDLHNFLPYHRIGNKLYFRIKDCHRRTMPSRIYDWCKKKGTTCTWGCLETLAICW